MEIIKALASCNAAIKVDGLALYPSVSLFGFSSDPARFGIQVAKHAVVRFETEKLSYSVDGKDRAPQATELVLELSGRIAAVERSLISFLGDKNIDDLLKL